MSASEKKARISVIIPVCNAEHFLCDTFEAIQAQSFTDFELILVNDGSVDHSLNVCKVFQSQQPEDMVKILDGEKSGISAARNRGLDAASGEWIAFCDAGDLPEPDWLKILYDNAVRDNADLSCCAFQYLSAEQQQKLMNFPMEGAIQFVGAEAFRNRFLIPLMKREPAVHGYLYPLLFRRSLIEQYHIRFNPEVSLQADELFLMEYLLQTERITAQPISLYRLIRRDNNAERNGIESDYDRELNGMSYSEGRLAIFRKSGLAESYPDLEPEFSLSIYAHMIRLVCCDPARDFEARMKAFQLIAMKIRQENIRVRSKEGKRLLFLLFYLPFLLPWISRREMAKKQKKA